MSDASPLPRWRFLISPRWIAWHLFVIVAIAVMMLLGLWQFHRAEAGNSLSWAYTFEWPIFSAFALVFWVKTIRDELRPPGERKSEQDKLWLPAGVGEPPPWELDAGAGSPERSAGEEVAASPAADPAGERGAPEDELAEYNAYLARLSQEVRSTHGKWHRSR